MGKGQPYLGGFRLDSPAESGHVVEYGAAAVSIFKGDALFENGAGYATNVGTAFAATFLGVAMSDVDNSAGAAGDKNVLCIKPTSNLYFWVPNESATVAAQTDIGEVIDLESNDGVDVTDTTLVSWGFEVVDIDITTAATTAQAGGFVKGRFMPQPQ